MSRIPAIHPATLALAVALATVTAFVPVATADTVYHSQHLALTPVGGAPLRSGFVENIKANGPQIYAHEQFVLNGAAPNTTYTVNRIFYLSTATCPQGQGLPPFPVGTITTNAAGNGADDVVVPPEAIPRFLVGDHGVYWTVTDGAGTVHYKTACTTATLD